MGVTALCFRTSCDHRVLNYFSNFWKGTLSPIDDIISFIIYQFSAALKFSRALPNYEPDDNNDVASVGYVCENPSIFFPCHIVQQRPFPWKFLQEIKEFTRFVICHSFVYHAECRKHLKKELIIIIIMQRFLDFLITSLTCHHIFFFRKIEVSGTSKLSRFL